MLHIHLDIMQGIFCEQCSFLKVKNDQCASNEYYLPLSREKSGRHLNPQGQKILGLKSLADNTFCVVVVCHLLILDGFNQLLSFAQSTLSKKGAVDKSQHPRIWKNREIRRIEPRTAGWDARTLPLCYAIPHIIGGQNGSYLRYRRRFQPRLRHRSGSRRSRIRSKFLV